MDLEVHVGWAALRVPACSDVADDRAGVDDGAIDHALSERLHVRVVVVRPALTLDPDLVAAEHIGPGTGDDPSFTGEQWRAPRGEDVRPLVRVLVARAHPPRGSKRVADGVGVPHWEDEPRSEESREGKKCVSTCRSRGGMH